MQPPGRSPQPVRSTAVRTAPRGRPRWIALCGLALLLLAARCPVPGQTVFVSGDGFDSLAYPSLFTLDTSTELPHRQVQEGDLFRVLAPGRLLNLNAYRGLQVIDFTDVARPRIVGRLAVSGTPVELYVVEDVAFVLVNGAPTAWSDALLSFPQGGASVLAVDLRDPTQPRLLDQATLPGSIQTSRLVREGERAALYVAANEWRASDGQTRAVVRSFDVADARLTPVGGLELQGSATAVHATPELLLVARQEYLPTPGSYETRIALVDIRDPAGALVPGGELAVAGVVEGPFRMDVHRGILRVASGSTWSGTRTNHLQTFDVRDPGQPLLVDHVTFGAGESLFATLFLGDRAFCVTYLRVDPFHAFAISEAGVIRPGAEFVVSGWNDFFRPVFADTRLIGIGVDDQGTTAAAVSLYDVADVDRPEPLLARARAEAGSGWSEARFDHRAFSVLEEAVAAPGPGGVLETGLVLLPVSGWDAAREAWVDAVQLFTFSANTLTRRGVLPHGSPVRRSFAAGEALVANLSEAELSLFDSADPAQPVERGRLALAPSYTGVFRFADHWVRVADGGGRGWFSASAPDAVVEVVPASEDPDLGEPVARFAIPGGAAVHRTGSYLVTVVTHPASDGGAESAIEVHDLREPARPQRIGTLRTDRLLPAHGSGPAWIALCLACDLAPWWGAGQQVVAVPDALVFLQSPWDRDATLDVLDLGDPAAPRFADPLVVGAGGTSVGLLAEDRAVWVAWKRASRPNASQQPRAAYFVQRVELAAPGAPVPGDPINVPGTLIAVDGARLFTLDRQWQGTRLESAVVRLALEPPRARVEAVRWFPERSVERVLLDGAGQLLVSHGPEVWTFGPAGEPPTAGLSVLDADADDLAVLSELPLEPGSALLAALPGRALLRAQPGLLVLDLDDPAATRLRARFPTAAWLQHLLIDGRTALAAAGPYGILRFDLDAEQLPATGAKRAATARAVGPR